VTTTDLLSHLPSVDKLLSHPGAGTLVSSFGHALTVDALRAALDDARQRIRAGGGAPEPDALVESASTRLQEWVTPRPRPAINATGVIIHTNLGRAPLSDQAVAVMGAAAAGYSDLEYDLSTGERGHRMAAVEDLVCRLTGAESALVVNNNAGAVLLALIAHAAGREVVISRGQLIEIGGGFRIPEVLVQSGARLVEVGTTNRTHRRDYEAALTEHTAAILRAHSSNFRVVGFTAEVSIAEMVEIGRPRGVPVFDDLGSGALLDTAAYGLMHEPMPQESLAAGATLVCFSGDKLLGGPQAGIVIGQKKYVEPLKRHPLARALRADKLCLAALSATLTHYLKREAEQEVPVWRMISMPLDEIGKRAKQWARKLRQAGIEAEVIEGRSTVGGGSLPGETLPTWLVAVTCESPDGMAVRLRRSDPPVIARIEDGRLVLDPRTVMASEEKTLLGVVAGKTVV
jgi:L-seryl-tRNA(Ser) seleniumtransferase